MTIERSTRILFDASCLIAAAGSMTGGSGFLLNLCTRRLLAGVVSTIILLEAERNIAAKMGADALSRYRALLEATPLVVAPAPPVAPDSPWLHIVNGKDVHVISAALAAGAPYLVTLDQHFAREVGRTDLPLRALTPGVFIREVLTGHVDYPSALSS